MIVGIQLGWELKWEAELDERNGILIPSEIREGLKLRQDQKFKIETRGRPKVPTQYLERSPEEEKEEELKKEEERNLVSA
jgi:bifunctional DNA-binding transcriptional regulator/antitoxin component of YhaV-PrlF toxin-antitoxin module